VWWPMPKWEFDAGAYPTIDTRNLRHWEYVLRIMDERHNNVSLIA